MLSVCGSMRCCFFFFQSHNQIITHAVKMFAPHTHHNIRWAIVLMCAIRWNLFCNTPYKHVVILLSCVSVCVSHALCVRVVSKTKALANVRLLITSAIWWNHSYVSRMYGWFVFTCCYLWTRSMQTENSLPYNYRSLFTLINKSFTQRHNSPFGLRPSKECAVCFAETSTIWCISYLI